MSKVSIGKSVNLLSVIKELLTLKNSICNTFFTKTYFKKKKPNINKTLTQLKATLQIPKLSDSESFLSERELTEKEFHKKYA